MIRREDIQIRDPYVFVKNNTYYLYGTTDADCWRGSAQGFDAYTSANLQEFDGPFRVFSAGNGFWGTRNFWAPELHFYRGAYCLFASFKADGRARATAVLRADNPLGPFTPWGAEALTPPDWECLDGTLFVDDRATPWLVFCHEWVQQGGGTICAVRLRKDLSAARGKPLTLLAAKDAPWTREVRHSSGAVGHVTDGPFLWRGREKLWMLWSSLTPSGYAAGLSYSASGGIAGPWLHLPEPLYAGDGGHGMLFLDIYSRLTLALHAPNKTPDERPLFLRIRDAGDHLEIIKEPTP